MSDELGQDNSGGIDSAATPVNETPLDTGTAENKGTILGGAGDTPDKAATAPADWPTNWRELATKGMDEKDSAKEIKRLERFGSPNDIYKAYREAEKKLSSGDYKTGLPKDATDEQLATWRKENGVPDKPEGYDLKIDGVVVGDQDKPYVDSFLQEMHAKNATPEMVQTALKAYYNNINRMNQQLLESDSDYRNESEETLRKEWGGEFKANINHTLGTLDTYGRESRDMLLESRLPNGRLVGDDPAMLKMLSQMSRDINPVTAIVPGVGQTATAAIAEEKASLVKMMGDKRSAYWKGDRAPELQERYRELVSYEQRQQNRA